MPLLRHVTSRGWNITSAGEKWIIQSRAKKEFGVCRFIYQQHISFSKQSTQQNHQSHFQTIALPSLSERWLQFRSAGGNLWRVPATWGQLWKMTGEAVSEFLHQERGPSAPLLAQNFGVLTVKGLAGRLRLEQCEDTEVKRAFYKSVMTHWVMSSLFVH